MDKGEWDNYLRRWNCSLLDLFARRRRGKLRRTSSAGIMAIGWDSIGDLKTFGNKEDMKLAKLLRQSGWHIQWWASKLLRASWWCSFIKVTRMKISSWVIARPKRDLNLSAECFIISARKPRLTARTNISLSLTKLIAATWAKFSANCSCWLKATSAATEKFHSTDRIAFNFARTDWNFRISQDEELAQQANDLFAWRILR